MRTFKTQMTRILAIAITAGAMSSPIQAHAMQVSVCSYIRNTVCTEPATVLQMILSMWSFN